VGMQNFTVIIPARMASTRLPRKTLLMIGGKPMIQHVFEKAKNSGASRVIIATDHPEIEKACTDFGAEVCLTSDHHLSGTDRIGEVIEKMRLDDHEIIVNVQGDEPLMPCENITQVAKNLADRTAAHMATLCWPIQTMKDLFSPHQVKVVIDQNQYALYFSRAPIPWNRDRFVLGSENTEKEDIESSTVNLASVWYRHLGIYAYRVAFLRQFIAAPQASIEQYESLEQLRALFLGCKIHVDVAHTLPPIGVDTQEDLERIRNIIKTYTQSNWDHGEAANERIPKSHDKLCDWGE